MSELSEMRVGRITGSRVSAILGLSPWQTRADVLRAMVREALGAPPEFCGNAATRWGQRMEPLAIMAYEQQTGLLVEELGCIVHPDHDFLAATPDGGIGEHGLIEVKCPYRGTYTQMPDYYLPQVQLQLAVTGRAWCDAVIAHMAEDGQVLALHVQRIDRDAGWLDRHMDALREFCADYLAALESPEPHLAPLPGSEPRTDQAWREAVEAWREAQERLSAARADVDAAIATLRELAGDQPAKGCGVQLIRTERPGAIRYADALRALAPDADLEPYRGQPSVSWSVRTCKEQGDA